MARIEKTVFISYRRTDVYTALAVYENLKNQGYDVFFDYRSISSGDFEQILTSNIKARAHFLLILTPTALNRCNEPGDWLRREIEFAVDQKRNIIPLFFKGFRFGDPSVTEKLTGKLKNLNRYNGLNVHEDYFDEAMQRLRIQYLNIPLETVLHPVSTEVQRLVIAEQIAADKALEQLPDVKELAKQDQVKPNKPKARPTPKQRVQVSAIGDVVSLPDAANDKLEASVPKFTDTPRRTVPKEIQDVVRSSPTEKPRSKSGIDFRWIGGIAGGLVISGLLIWGASSFFSNLSAAPEPTQTLQTNGISLTQPPATTISQSEPTNTVVPTETTIPATATLSIGATTTGKDGMSLLYIPAGKFTMGAINKDDLFTDDTANEKPIHAVSLDAFWIDKTEITNAMYKKCVDDQSCNPPTSTKSHSRDSYYGNSEFTDYPVIYVSWEAAKAYCLWAGRRLPTEAEWEKAARGDDGRKYPWGNESPGANFLNKKYQVGDTAKVGQFPDGASPYGAFDMAGNVWEWVADWYSDKYYASSPESNPLGPESGQYHVLRGGSWNDSFLFLDHTFNSQPVYLYYFITWRVKGNQDNGAFNIGFRCAMSTAP